VCRRRPQDHPAGAVVQDDLDVLERPDPTSHLDRAHDRPADVPDRLAVVTLLERGVEVDHVEAPSALRLEPDRDVHRVVVVGGLRLGVSADEPHRPAAPDVDRRDHDHAARTSRTNRS
jgi:hypothetical protein